MALNYAMKNGMDSFAMDLLRLERLDERISRREAGLKKLGRSVQQAIQELGPIRLSEIVEVLTVPGSDSSLRDDVVECLERLERQKIVAASGRPGLKVWSTVASDSSLSF